MNVLIFSHKSDIDGMGGVIFTKLAFSNVTYELCENYDINEKINNYLTSNEIYNYDAIFVTDLSIEEPLLTTLANNPKLNQKIQIFDHHKSSLNLNLDKYDFSHIIIENENGLCSGTSLFYQYLIKEKYLESKQSYEEFSELTRLYDTWEWKLKYHEETPRELSLLFDIYGTEGYINQMIEKLMENEIFHFSETEHFLIENKKKQIQEKLKMYSNNVYLKQIDDYRVGITFIDYEYRNDVAEFIKDKYPEIDYVMLIAFDKCSISFRTISNHVDLSKIAEHYGGKGHQKASSAPINTETKEKIIDLLMK